MNETEEYLQEIKKSKYTLHSESDTLSNEKYNNSHSICKVNDINKNTDDDASQIEANYEDDEDFYEEQADADDGARQRRQYFQNPLQKIKSIEDESIYSHWESDFPSNRLGNVKRVNNQQSFEAINSLNGSRNNNLKMMNMSNSNNEIKINLNNLSSLNQEKGNQQIFCKDNIKHANTCDVVISKQVGLPNFTKNGQINDQDAQIAKMIVNDQDNKNLLPRIQLDNQNQLQDNNCIGNLQNQRQEESGLTGVWKHSSLLIITLVKKFQNMLMSHNNQNKFRALDQKHFQVLGDKSVNYRYYNKYKQEQDQLYLRKMKTQGTSLKRKQTTSNQKGRNTFQYYRQISTNPQQNDSLIQANCLFLLLLSLLKNVRIIQPNSRFKIAWNIVIFILLIVNFFIIPLKLSYDSFMKGQLIFKGLTYFTGFLFSIDTIMNFNSAYFSKGLIITDRKKIIKNYMKKNFFIDLFTLLAFAFSQFSYYYTEAGILIKILKLAPIMENFEEILNLRQRGQAILSLAKLIFFVLMVTHILGCSFFLFARLEQTYFPEGINWIDSKNSWEKDWYDQYILSLYWSVVTMITVGYGDVTPSNTQERLFCIIVMLISCGVFAYSINQIGRILEELSKKDAIFRDNISLITSYLKQRGISYDLQLRIRKYFQYLHKENLEDNEKSEGLMDLLPSSLKNELGREMYAKIINDQKVFRLNFSQRFILDLSLKMKEKRLGPEELIFQERDYLDRLYFLIKGQVELFVNVKDSNNNQTTSVNFLSKGRLLGQNGFFSQLPCSTGARCVNVTSLIYITRDDFIDTIKKHSKDYEKFCMLRDNLQVNHISRGLGTKCHLCGSFNHSFQSCHLVRYTPMKEKIILRYNKMEQGRDPNFGRNDRRNPTSSARIAHEYLKDTTINFLLEFNPAETDEETVLEVVENLKKYYAKEEMRWKQQIKSDRVIEDDLYDGNNNAYSPSVQPDPNSVILNSENILRQHSLQIGQQDNNIQQAPMIRKKKKTLSYLQVEDINSESNQSFQPLNILNSPLKRKRVKEKGSSSENLNTFNLTNTTPSNTQNQQQNQNESKDNNQQTNNINNTTTNSQPINTIGGYLKQRNYIQFRTTSSRPDKSPQDESLAGANSDQLSNSIFPTNQANLYKSIRMNKRRNNLLGAEQEELIKKNCFSDLLEFDRYMIFEIYFIDGNINKVLEHYNNEFIHLKIKDELETQTRKRNHFKRLVTKKQLTKSERSMNILKNKIIQKRSQGGKHGTYYTQNQESPLPSINFSVKSGKTLLQFKNGIGDTIGPGLDSSVKNNSNKNANNLNQTVSFNDYMIKNEITNKSGNQIFSGGVLDSSDKQSDKPPNVRKAILSAKKQLSPMLNSTPIRALKK